MYTKWRYITFKSISTWFKIRFELKNLPFISSIRFSNFWANATSWGVGGLLGPYGSLIGVCDLKKKNQNLIFPPNIFFKQKKFKLPGWRCRRTGSSTRGWVRQILRSWWTTFWWCWQYDLWVLEKKLNWNFLK